MILRQSVNSNCGCGSCSCSLCKMRLVCADSPYCSIRTQNNKNEQQIDTNTIMNGLNIIASALDKQGSMLSEFNKKIELIEEYIEKNQNNTDLIINSLNKEKVYDNDNYYINEELESDIVESSMVPYSENLENNTILTEKKTIFGKTKWVPDKKKK